MSRDGVTLFRTSTPKKTCYFTSVFVIHGKDLSSTFSEVHQGGQENGEDTELVTISSFPDEEWRLGHLLLLSIPSLCRLGVGVDYPLVDYHNIR